MERYDVCVRVSCCLSVVSHLFSRKSSGVVGGGGAFKDMPIGVFGICSDFVVLSVAHVSLCARVQD